MNIANLIPGLPAGVNYVIVCIACIILLFHGVHVTRTIVHWVSNVGKPTPRKVNVTTILSSPT